MNMITYSIIIPHKNIPSLLQRCLNSIPRRDDIQVIVVDDNSDPEKVDFNHFPGLGEPQVEVIFTKEGKGAGYARNVGLELVKGRWLLFADADDLFCNGFLDSIDRYKSSDFDLIFFGFTTVYSDTLETAPSRNQIYEELLEKGNLDELKYKSYVPWAKMISVPFIQKNKIRFDETKASNDVMFSTYVSYYSGNITSCSTVIYMATERRGSLWFGMTYESLKARIEVSCRHNRFMRKAGLNHFRLYSYDYVSRCKLHGYRAYLNGLKMYLLNEVPQYICKDMYRLLKAKLIKKNHG